MKRCGQKEHLKQGDEQKQIYILQLTLIHKNIANSTDKIIVCVYVCVCVCVCMSNTTKLQKDYISKCPSFYGWKQTVSLRLEKVS